MSNRILKTGFQNNVQIIYASLLIISRLLHVGKMKRYLYLLLLVIFISYHEKVYCQEEFHGNHNGLSLLYLQGFNAKTNAVGFSMYFKKGLIFGLGLESVNNTKISSLDVLFCPNWGDDSNHLKVGFGPSYAYLQNQHIIGFNAGLIRCFFTDSKFPFSLNASFSPHLIFAKNKSSSPYYQSTGEKYVNKFTSVLGCGLTQAFFAKSTVYPFIGISVAHYMESKIDLFSAMIGINIKL